VGSVKKIIKKIKPDVCHFHHIHCYISYHCFKIAQKYSKAVFLTTHDAMLFNYGKLMPKGGNCVYKVGIKDKVRQARKKYNPFRDILIRHYLKYIDKIFSVSDSLKEVLEVNGIKNVATVHNGIDVNDWEFNQKKTEQFKEKYKIKNKKVILFCGRLSGAKGGEVFLRALEVIVKNEPDALLLVAGLKNTYTQEMMKLANELKVQDAIRFTGWLDRAEMITAYQAADVVVVPSVCLDCFPTINLEAMASQRPVVGTCFGGTPEVVVDNETGYIVNPLNIPLLAEKIVDLLQNPDKAKRFGLKGYQRVKNKFSLDGQVENILEWYCRSVVSD
jgi:glycosyltransferase involved in cell wall biosynthesis